MELWIRSQDKKCLIKAKIIKYENSCLRGATDDDGWYYDLGRYKKERALEVLDEIQNLLKPELITKFKGDVKYNENSTPIDILIPYDTFKKTKIQELSTYVYEMPEE